jgi:hypothetical protein
MALATLRAVASTSASVFSPRTISSNFMMLAGLKKCIPITSAGRFVTAAISLMSRLEVLEARMAPLAAIPVELGEDFLLEIHVLEHRLDD